MFSVYFSSSLATHNITDIHNKSSFGVNTLPSPTSHLQVSNLKGFCSLCFCPRGATLTMSVLFPSIVRCPHLTDIETLASSAVVDTGKLSDISGGETWVLRSHIHVAHNTLHGLPRETPDRHSETLTQGLHACLAITGRRNITRTP